MPYIRWHEIDKKDRPKVVAGIVLLFVLTLGVVDAWVDRDEAQRRMGIAEHDIAFQSDAIEQGKVGIHSQMYEDGGVRKSRIRIQFVSRGKAEELLEHKAWCRNEGLSRSSECDHVATGYLSFYDYADDYLDPSESLESAEEKLQEEGKRKQHASLWLGLAVICLAGASWWLLHVMGRGRSR